MTMKIKYIMSALFFLVVFSSSLAQGAPYDALQEIRVLSSQIDSRSCNEAGVIFASEIYTSSEMHTIYTVQPLTPGGVYAVHEIYSDAVYVRAPESVQEQINQPITIQYTDFTDCFGSNFQIFDIYQVIDFRGDRYITLHNPEIIASLMNDGCDDCHLIETTIARTELRIGQALLVPSVGFVSPNR